MLSESEFSTSICTLCSVCSGTVYNAKTFCYTKYSSNPKKFMRVCFPKLKKLEYWPEYDYTSEEKTFKDIFCNKSCKNKKKNQCFNNNRQFIKCLDNFLNQLDNLDFYGYRNSQTTAKKDPEVSVSFICGGSKMWKEMCNSLNDS